MSPSDSRSMWDTLKDDPILLAFFEELQDIFITSPDFPFTIPSIANRIVPDSLEEDQLMRDVRVFVLVTRLVGAGIMRASRDKTISFGDALPTYEFAAV